MVAVLVVVAATVSGAGVTQVQAQAQTDDCGFPYTDEDATGTQVTLDEEPETVVTLGPSATQTLVEMGSGEKVDGAGGFSEYLGIEFETVTPLDEETGFFQYETDAAAENVVDLDPDLVVVAGTIISDETVENTYRAAGDLDVYKTSPSATADDIPPKVEDVGRLVGNCAGADEAAQDVREEIEAAERAAAGQERPGFVYLVSATEGGGASVLSEGSFVVDVVETAGGENVLADEVETPFGTVGSEVLLDEADDINWIVTTEGTEVPEEGIPYGEIDAVQQDRIIKLNPNEINQDAPRITRPLSALSEAFFPDEDRGVIGGGGGDDTSDDGVGLSLGVADTSALEPIGNSSVAEFVGGPVTTVALDGEYAGNASVEPLAEAQTPGTFVSGANVTVPDEAVDADGTVTFSVERSTLENAGIAVEELHVAKREGGWNVLETDRADLREEALLEARTTFSEFAVVASSEPTAVADASVEDGEVSLSAAGSSDEYGEIESYVWNADGETYEGENVAFEADGDGDGEATVTVTNDAGLTGEATVEFSVEGEETEEDETEGDETEGDETEAETGDGDGNGDGDTGDGDTDDGSEGLPGFTALAAVVALVVAAAVARSQRDDGR